MGTVVVIVVVSQANENRRLSSEGSRAGNLKFRRSTFCSLKLKIFTTTIYQRNNHAKHAHICWQLMPSAHQSNMFEPRHVSSSGRAFAIRKCNSVQHSLSGGADLHRAKPA